MATEARMAATEVGSSVLASVLEVPDVVVLLEVPDVALLLGVPDVAVLLEDEPELLVHCA